MSCVSSLECIVYLLETESRLGVDWEKVHNEKRNGPLSFCIRPEGYAVSMSDLADGKPASAGRICVFCGSSVGADPNILPKRNRWGSRWLEAAGAWFMGEPPLG